MSNKKLKKPWPTKAVMEQIYEQNLWGGRPGELYSGDGSHNPEIVNPYISAVTNFLSDFDPPLVVCDLGCGDFNVGKQLAPFTRHYIAVDIVEDLIAIHQKNNTQEHISFQCLDIAKDELPQADCAILRQVLQHLSNEEIEAIVSKLYAYKYVLVTEHVPIGDFTPNKDIISGQVTRLRKNSGVHLMAAPFNLKARAVHKMSSVPDLEYGGCIETLLYTF